MTRTRGQLTERGELFVFLVVCFVLGVIGGAIILLLPS